MNRAAARRRRRGMATLLSVLLLTLLVGSAAAQAWVPEKGEGSFSTSYNYISSNGHFNTDGSKVAEAAAKAQSVIFDFEYGVTDKLAVNFSVPIVAARYVGTNPPIAFLRNLFDQTMQAAGPGTYGHQFLDDGSYHPTVQDFQFGTRYNLVSRPFVLTPFVVVVIPSHDYAYVGEAAPGRNLREFQFGTNVARRLTPFLPKAYLDGQVLFGIPQENLHVRTNRTSLSLETGYFITRKLAARGFGIWQHTFTGLRFPIDLTTPEIALTHERLLKARYWHVGGGISYVISPKTEVGADVVSFVAGSDTHYGTGVSLRITRTFIRTPRP
jgi:hypothetical protein